MNFQPKDIIIEDSLFVMHVQSYTHCNHDKQNIISKES